MEQYDIRLTLLAGSKVEVKPDSISAEVADEIRFFTDDVDTQFEGLIHNAEGIFETCPRICSFLVDKDHVKTLTVKKPNNNYPVKYYSVCVVVDAGSPQPLPPDAPPRIIIKF